MIETPSRGVLTVPWCPDRYTSGDTDARKSDRSLAVVIDRQPIRGVGRHSERAPAVYDVTA